MKLNCKNLSKILILLLFVSSCDDYESNDEVNNDTEQLVVNTLNIPEGFNFSTHTKTNISITDPNTSVKYEVFQYSDDIVYIEDRTFTNEAGENVTEPIYSTDLLDNLIFTASPSNGVIKLNVNIPSFCEKLYLRRKDNLKYSSYIVDVIDGELNFNYNNSNSTSRSQKTDYLYSVNTSGQFFSYDPTDGSSSILTSLPSGQGSITAAIDNENNLLYAIGTVAPHPLLVYDIAQGTWSTSVNVGESGPRLEYYNNLLYYSTANRIYTIDPSTGTLSNAININGLDSASGGDLAFSEDGTLYICTFSGLYSLVLNNGEYDATRLSADSLPFAPTSMAIDSNGDLWLGSISGSSGQLIIMDTSTGGYQYTYGTLANNSTTVPFKINDLTTHTIVDNNYVPVDTDGDSVDDDDDEYPTDPNKAYNIYGPSKFGKGTVAFEDLWPSEGDYDFNDLAFNYQTKIITNSQNKAVQIDITCNMKSVRVGFNNGFGIQFDGITSSQIQSVTGAIYTKGYITNNANGTESGQSNAVIILTDDAVNLNSETVISIILDLPIDTGTLGASPFNPFLIIDMVRANEVHLPYYATTSLGNNIPTELGTKDDDGNYISASGYPWAISIIHDFKVPKEGIPITDGYNYFGTWAESGGVTNLDWYKDSSGNRNNDKLED
jgi:LruC domain-containing protein